MVFFKALTNAIMKEKRKAGVRAYYSKGEVFLSRVYGLRLEGDHYMPDKKHEPAIKAIFQMLADGRHLPEIKAELDLMGARDSSNNRFGISRICSIAARPVYAGFLLQRGRLVPIKNMIPLIPLALWRKAQKTLKAEKTKLVS